MSLLFLCHNIFLRISFHLFSIAFSFILVIFTFHSLKYVGLRTYVSVFQFCNCIFKTSSAISAWTMFVLQHIKQKNPNMNKQISFHSLSLYLSFVFICFSFSPFLISHFRYKIWDWRRVIMKSKWDEWIPFDTIETICSKNATLKCSCLSSFKVPPKITNTILHFFN
jgi:hypothetical protein